MKRKVVKQGISTFMVSLPKKWVDKNKIKKGEEVVVEEKGDSLHISKENQKHLKKETSLNLTSITESSIRTAIVNTYRSGYNLIHIKFKTKEQYKIITETLRNYLIGFDVISKTENSCKIENITEPSPDQFDNIIRKIFYKIEALFEGTNERITLGKSFEDYNDLSLTIHQYDNFTRRVVSKEPTLVEDSNLFWTFMGILIHSQREIYHLNRYLDKNKIIIKDFKIITELIKMFNLLREAYIKKDISKIEEIHELEKKVIYKGVYFLEPSKKELPVIYHSSLSIKQLYLASSPLLGMLLSSKI